MKKYFLTFLAFVLFQTAMAQAPNITCNWDGQNLSVTGKDAVGQSHYKGVMFTGRFDIGTSEGFRTLSIAFPAQEGTFNLASGSKETEIRVNSSNISFSSTSDIPIQGTITVSSVNNRRVTATFSFTVEYNGSRKRFTGNFNHCAY